MDKIVHLNSTTKNDVLDLTSFVNDFVESAKVREGFVLIYVPHATCAVIINENYDLNICDDLLSALNKLIPEGIWKHDNVDDNAAAHIKASIIGPSELIPIKDSKLQLGTWQSPMLCDFDGPKKRTVIMQIHKS